MRIKKYFSYRTEVRQRMEFHLIFSPLSKIQECKHDDGNESRKKILKRKWEKNSPIWQIESRKSLSYRIKTNFSCQIEWIDDINFELWAEKRISAKSGILGCTQTAFFCIRNWMSKGRKSMWSSCQTADFPMI